VGKIAEEKMILYRVKKHSETECHSGLTGILLCFLSACTGIKKDSRRASLAGMTEKAQYKAGEAIETI
jgi:hypothetical protein